jgi:hypothetical protein
MSQDLEDKTLTKQTKKPRQKKETKLKNTNESKVSINLGSSISNGISLTSTPPKKPIKFTEPAVDISQLLSSVHSSSVWNTLDTSIVIQPDRKLNEREIALYPSEASALAINEYGEEVVLGGCIRKSWFRNKAQRIEHHNEISFIEDIEAEVHSPQQMWKFYISSKTEEAIREESIKAGIYHAHSHRFEYRLPCSKEEEALYGLPLVRGEVDLVVKESPESENLIGIEIKSITGYYGQKQVFGSRNKAGQWTVVPEPKDNQLLQAILYAYYFCVVNKTYKFFKLIYLSRENGQRIEFDIDLVPHNGKHRVYINKQPYRYFLYAEDIIERYVQTHFYIMKDELPPRDFDLYYSPEKIATLALRGKLSKTDMAIFNSKGGSAIRKGDWNCSYCPFKSMCYKPNGTPIDYTGKTIEDKDIRIEVINESNESSSS